MFRFMAGVRARRPAEQGFYAVWFALTFVTFTAFAALAIEFNRWQMLATQAQKAADAAALAGAVFMPENQNNKAFDTARNIASLNGFTDGQKGVTISTAKGRLPNQLKVTVSLRTNNPWGALVNYGSTTIVRSAVAEYQVPQNLGSPQNSYGNDPESGSAQPQFWGNLFGPSSSKGKGDAIQSAGPNATHSICDADNCPGQVNADYDAKGYFYGIDVPTGATSNALKVQVYDPAFVHVGDNCGDSDAKAKTSLDTAATLTAAQIPGYSGSVTPATRYASAGSSAFCNGDNWFGDGSTTLNPWTVWTLRAPDVTPWDPSNNPIVCQAEFPGVYPENGNDLPNGTTDGNRLKALLQQSTNYPGTNPGRPFNQFFRQWVNLCTVNQPVNGTYFLQVQTATKIDGAATPNGGGANRFAIRVGSGTNFGTNNGLHVYGNARMGAYANATGANTQFYLTRVLPGEAGKTLVLNFYDTGDASQAGTLGVLPPPDSNVGGAFSGCQYTAPPGNSTGPPWGTFSNTATGCKINNVSSATFNGQWVTWQIPIPNNYDCDDTSALGCWVRLQFVYPNGTSVQDTTTWSAYILGEPVRIIQ